MEKSARRRILIAVADCLEKYEKCADGRWRIAERKIVLVFESEAHKAG